MPCNAALMSAQMESIALNSFEHQPYSQQHHEYFIVNVINTEPITFVPFGLYCKVCDIR